MRKITEIAKDLLFPKRCMFCEEIAEYPDFICKKCRIDYPLKNEDICERCGKLKENCICRDLSGNIYRIFSACKYEGAAITNIKQFKKDKNSALGENFADMLVNVLADHPETDSFPYITYIPMEKEKIRQRGHNMAETLASEIAKKTGRVLIVPPIEKIYTEKFQHDLKRQDRFKNASLSFLDKGTKVKGDIIIVDDVITTGATIERAAEILKNNGAQRVIALSIASTQKRERQ